MTRFNGGDTTSDNTEPALRGRAAVVTGGAKGIGLATAVTLAQSGVHVTVLDVDRAATKESEAASNGQITGRIADVSDSASLRSAIDDAADRYGRLDYLVSAAGIIRYGLIGDFSERDWDAVIGVNLSGAYRSMKYAIPHMLSGDGGAIVTVASVQAYVTQQNAAAYAASKGAIVAMTKAAALDYASEGIRINAVAPGSVRTPMLHAAAELFAPENPEAAITEWGAKHPIGRVIEPEEVAKAIVFLLSDRASAVTGATLLVDGGLAGKAAV